MDLERIDTEPTPEEKAAVDEVLGPPTSGWQGGQRNDVDGRCTRGGHQAREMRHLLLPALESVQQRVGWVSDSALSYICRRLTVAPAEAYGVASFYALLSTRPRPPRVAHVCDDIACRAAGAETLCDELEQELGPPGTVSNDGKSTWHRSPCLGLCEKAPAAFFQLAGENERAYAPTSARDIIGVLPGKDPEPVSIASAPQTKAPRDGNLRLLRRVGAVDPESLHDYRAHGGYAALRRAVHLGPDGVLREIRDSKIRGRGGAAFPKGAKWEAVARAPHPRYVVCNADESEPGTFKDRVLMEEDPFAVLEALTIAGYGVGAEKGFVYIRGEYPLAYQRLQNAIEQARRHGLLGENVSGEGFRFEVEIRRGAGAYVCGEETALFNSIEGYRGEPRNKPPFPTEAGLFGKPTVVNNVETLINVLDILLESGPVHAELGTSDSTGHKLFCLSGCVRRPGLYEVEFGATLNDVIDLAGGTEEGRSLTAVLLGGAAGSFIPLDQLDVPLTFEGVQAIGASLGSGAVTVFDDTVDLNQIVLRIAAFFRDESCGQCVPCRVGTVRQEEALQRLAHGGPYQSAEKERVLIDEVARAMKDASICGLGQTASNAVQSALALGLFPTKEVP
jgi:NADH-quinone oxidoreductase subunit F